MSDDIVANLRADVARLARANAWLSDAILAVTSGARTIDELDAWMNGPRGATFYSWRDERQYLLDRLARLQGKEGGA